MKTQKAKLLLKIKSITELQVTEMNTVNGGTASLTPGLMDFIDHIKNCGPGEDMCNGHSGQQ